MTSESPAQERARLRREKRAGGGADRLSAITALQGGSQRDVQKDAIESTVSRPESGTATPDPEEVDISKHHYQPRRPSPFAIDASSTSAFGSGQAADGSPDIMAMMQQMMAGADMPGGDMPPPGARDSPLANLLSAMQGGDAQQPPPEKSAAWIWRLVHALCSLGLAAFIVLNTPFDGSKLARKMQETDDWTGAAPENTFGHFFYLFATFEIVLQTSRYFLEKGQLQGNGLLNTVGMMLPSPYAGYVRVIGRYSVIYSTIVSDAMVVVFVLGVASWWNGGAAV